MSALSFDNPVFVTYAVAAALMVLKVMGQGWMTVFRMLHSDSGLVNPEDLQAGPINPNPRPDQLDLNDYVDRSRRMHRNDLENIPAFLAIGILFVIAGPSPVCASVLMYGFVGCRIAHAVAYVTKQRHELRATFYTFGSLAVITMAIWVLVAALTV